jgi:hypothetical protein
MWRAIAIKAAWWAAGILKDAITDYVDGLLLAAETADQAVTDTANRRRIVLEGLMQTHPLLPEGFQRLALECAVTLVRLGVTGDKVRKLTAVAEGLDSTTLANGAKREAALSEALRIFPDMPERAARLLVEFAVARLRVSAS